MNLSKVLSAFLLALVMMTIMIQLPASATETTNTTITVDTSKITLGERDANSKETLKTKITADTVFAVDTSFYVPVIVSNLESFNGYNLQLTYNPDVLKFEGVQTKFQREVDFEGETLTQTYGETLLNSNEPVVNTTTGIVMGTPNATGTAVTIDYSTSYGYLFFAKFTVVGKTTNADGKEAIGIQAKEGSAAIGVDGVANGTTQFVAGEINVEKEAATALTFKDGQTSYDFATLKADKYTLTAPGAGYHFAGWFSGLTADGTMITTDAQGRYILSDKATADDTSFNAVECRPKYDEAPESGTFNALWIHEDNTATFSAMTLEVYETSFKYRKISYTQQTDEIYSNNDAIRAAWKGAAGNGRVKLVKDMNVSGMEYNSNAESGYIEFPLKLDMNGRTLTGVQKSSSYKGEAVVYFRSGTSGNALESSRGQGCLEQTYFGTASYSSAVVLEATNVSIDVLRDVDLIANNTTGPTTDGFKCGQSTIAKMENVNITLSSTGTLAKPENTRAIYSSNSSKGTQFGTIHNCTVTSNGYLIYADRDTANFGTMTGCTMTATGTAVTCPIYFVGGKAAFGAGNTVTAESSSLFGGAPEIAFTSAESTYQCAADGNVLAEGVRVSQTPVAGAIASSENGVLTFVPGFTLQFYNYDGTELLWADRYKTGETPADHTLTYGIVGIESYEHLGWSTTLGGTELTDPATLDADTALYAVRKVVTLPAVVSLSSNGGAAVPYASWDLAMDALDYYAVVVIKLLDNVEVSNALSAYNSYTLDLNGHTLTYTGSSSALYEMGYDRYSEYFTLTSSAAEKGTFVVAQGAKGIVYLHGAYTNSYPITISNVKIVADHLAANNGWDQNGAPITIVNKRAGVTETLTMTNVEIVAANCPAVEFGIGNATASSLIRATFTNVKLSGNPVAVAVKSNNISGTNHVYLTVDAASSFKGAEGIQVTNGNFGLTLECSDKDDPTLADEALHDIGDGWYSFAHIHNYNSDSHECDCGDVEKFTISWDTDGDGNVDHTTTVAYGTVPTPPANPTKESTAEYSYTFDAWSPEIVAVTGEATYTATYTANKRSYTITFVDEDGTTVLKTETIVYGEMPIAPANPSKAATAQYTYTFNGWDNEVVAVTGEATYTATYTESKRSYTITFVDEDGTTVLKTETVAYGETPEYNGETPTKAADANKHYTFTGWDKEIATVTGDATYKAIFEGADHTDAPDDGDHACDVCDAENATACGDSEKDHICDTDSACTAYSTGGNAHADGEDANHTCDYCNGAVEGEECVDTDNDLKCDECKEKLAFTITFKDYFGVTTTETFMRGETIEFPEFNPDSYSFNLEFLGWADATGVIVESATATEDETYTAKYMATGFKEGSLQMSVEYGAEGDIVLYVTLFVYADTSGQLGAPAVLHDSEKEEPTHKFGFDNQTIYMYKIGFTAEDIAAQGSYIYIQIGSGDGMYEEKINKVLFQYAAMLEHAGIVDGEANAENILKAQQTLIDSIIRYGGAVQDCFHHDSTDIDTNGRLTADKDDLADYKNVKETKTEKDTEGSAVITDFYGATGGFGTTIALRYYYNVTLPKEASVVKIGVIVSDEELAAPSGEFTNTATAKFYESEEKSDIEGTYMSTTDGMTINEIDDKYATIYVEYTLNGTTYHYYGDVIEYGIERFAKIQIYEYSPQAQDEQGNEIGGEGKTVADGKTYNTEQYVNMLIRILEANKAATDLEAERGVTAD